MVGKEKAALQLEWRNLKTTVAKDVTLWKRYVQGESLFWRKNGREDDLRLEMMFKWKINAYKTVYFPKV